jgi:CBS domain-containing protein
VGNLHDIFKSRELFFITPDQSVADAARYMTERNVGAVCVLQMDRLVGVLSERDMMKRVIAPNRDPQATKVSAVMTPTPVVVEISEPFEKCLKIMKKAGVRHLPVVDGDKLVGLLSLRDLLQVDLNEKVEEIKLMQDYIHYVPPSKPGL